MKLNEDQSSTVEGDALNFARRDSDRYYFVGRNDDVISSAGYRIGPTDTENVITQPAAVQSVAVIGKPNEIGGEAAVGLFNPGYSDFDQLTTELRNISRAAVGGHTYPREVEYVAELPMTSTGKIQRAVIREMERARIRFIH